MDVIYVEVLDESHRDRGMRDDLRVLAKCATHVALVGGTVSPGMALEREVGRAIGAEIIDHTELGAEPPVPTGGKR